MSKASTALCQHDRLELLLECADCRETLDRRLISRAEWDSQAIDLPDRQAMSLLGGGLLGAGALGGALPTGSPTDPTSVPTSGAPPDGQGLTGGVDPMGLLTKLSPDTSGAGSQPYSPESSSSSQS